MASAETSDDLVWRALADPSRRRILDLLGDGPLTTGQISGEFEISRIAVMKHLVVLAEAGIVLSRKHGRERWHYLNAVPLMHLPRRWVGDLDAGWARALLRLESRLAGEEVRGMAEADSILELDIAQELVLAASAGEVFTALTEEIDAWWGAPYLTSQAIGLVLEPSLGGSFREVWAGGGGKVLAAVTAIDPGRRLELTGPFHLGVVFGIVVFQLEDDAKGTLLRFSHRGIGEIDPETAEQFAGGWTELLSARLKSYVEQGENPGIRA